MSEFRQVNVTVSPVTNNVAVTVSNSRGARGGFTGEADLVDFTVAEAPAYQEGRVFYDEATRALSYYNDEADVAMNLGLETWVRVRNASGATITNGTAVYISGATGQTPTIAKARADSATTSKLIGIATHDIENNSTGYVTVIGTVRNVDTSAFNDGDRLYLSAVTAGALTATAPSSPNRIVQVGVVEYAHANNGKILVHPETESVSSTGIADSTATGRAVLTAASALAARTAIYSTNFINVKDHGATGDGVTDDRAAIQAAITALEASTTANTLYFPRGTYILDSSVADSNTHTASFRCLLLGSADLAGRDILIKGEPGAVMKQTLGTQRTHLMVALAKFRSLTVDGLKFEKDSTPLSSKSGPPAAEPNGNDAIAIVRHDSREIEGIAYVACDFVNMHGVSFFYGSNRNVRSKLKLFQMTGCKVLNPYGANTVDSGGAFGGGQQLYLAPWIDTALIDGNVFEGASSDLSDSATSPGGRCKDAALFGSAMHTIFTNNKVRRHGVEVVYVTNTHNFMGTTEGTFTVPAADGVTTGTLVHAAATASSGPGTFTAGMDINVQSVGRFEVTAYNAGTRTVTIVNHGASGNLAPGTSAGTADKFIYEDVLNDATLHISGNDIDGQPPTGAHATTAAFGIVPSVRGEVSGNTIRGCDVGIYNYAVISTPSFDQARGLIVRGNHITTRENSAASITAYGIALRTDDPVLNGNTVIIPHPTKTFGIWVNGNRSRIETNLVISLTAAANGYTDAERVVGIGVGNQSTATVATSNATAGCDVGIGPGQHSQNLPLVIYSHTSTGDVLAIDKQAAMTFPRTGAETSPHFSATLSSNYSLANNAYTKIPFNTEEFDTASCYDNATNYRFTPTVKGRYLISASVFFNTIGSGSTVAWQIRKNGSAVKTPVNQNRVSTAAAFQSTASLVVDMNGTTDYVEIFAYQNSGAAIDILSGTANSVFQGCLLP